MSSESTDTRSEQPLRGRPARLTRSRDQKVIAGVAGGLGEYFGVDPVVFRIGFVAVTLLGGSGILLYLIGWLAIPKEGHRRSVAQHAVGRGISGPAVGVSLLILAGIILVYDSFHWGMGRFTLSLLLVGAGAVLLWSLPGVGTNEEDDQTGRTDDGGGAPPTVPATPVATAAMPPAPPPPPTGFDDAEPPAPPPPPVGRTRTHRPPSPLGRGTLAAALVVAGVMGLADATDGIDINPEAYLATALLIVGLGLVIGAWWGRSRWLMIVGALLAVMLAGASTIDVPLKGGVGDRWFAPDNVGELRREMRLFAGDMDVDLTGLDLRGRVTDIEASIAFGRLTVEIPKDVRVVVDAEVDWGGEISVLGVRDEGIHAEVRRRVGPRGRGLVRLHLEVGAGEITVR